ncbi:MAG TPA: Fic family protein [Spirochaetota bacterium]|nr:Fic family protein [Spirochaetota bacterium]
MKSGYKPPFSITAKSINLIADISAQTERYVIRMEQEDGLLLRKINRIKTIHGSLAIEGNTIPESLITDIIEGRHVVAPPREIQEVKNAIKTYDAFASLDPYSVKDLLKAHALMMYALIDRPGHFRSGGVGVFAGDKTVHVAPPAERVKSLMNDLFDWLKKPGDHLLIKSCVFHYEFEFIHPFIDGNGRMGRLWQSLLLSKLHPVFEYLPVENMVFQNQQKYYDIIAQSTKAADCGIFIEFMLNEILSTLKKRQGKSLRKGDDDTVNDTVSGIVNLVKADPKITLDELAQRLNKSRRTITRNMKMLQDKGIISRTGSDRTGYWQVKD